MERCICYLQKYWCNGLCYQPITKCDYKPMAADIIEKALEVYKEIREKRIIEKQELIKSLKSTTVIMPK